MEFVELWNKNSDPRISTYVILGEGGSRCCIVRRYLCVSPLDGATSTSSIIELIKFSMLYHYHKARLARYVETFAFADRRRDVRWKKHSLPYSPACDACGEHAEQMALRCAGLVKASKSATNAEGDE